MENSKTISMTGATSGLGLRTAQQLMQRPEVRLIVGARNPAQAEQLRMSTPTERVTILQLDLASLASVRRFASEAIAQLNGDRQLEPRQLSAIALNAGIQITTGLEKSVDGFERTFATNHLGHFYLTHLLLPVLAHNAAVVSTASGTHDPNDKGSKLFGFRGGVFPNVEAVISGELDSSVDLRQQCLDRYATSKLCVILFTYGMARRISSSQARFVAFDPGLMPGTGLARDRSLSERLAWKYLMPALSDLIPGGSSPKKSATALARLLSEPAIAPTTGQQFDYQLKLSKTSEDSYREDWQNELYDKSIALTSIASESI